MDSKILVTYASKHGATASIAEAIAEELRGHGKVVNVLPVAQVKNVADYQAFIVGSAVYLGQWRKEAASFLETHKTLLASHDTWLFSSGPTGEGDPVELLNEWRFPEKLQPFADEIKPHDVMLFHGALETQNLNFAERIMIRGVKAPVGDFRDWDMIKGWAAAIAERLSISQPG